MAAIHDLINRVTDDDLKKELQNEIDRMSKQKKFGLVFEPHRPECTALYDVPVTIGKKVALKNGKIDELYIVLSIKDGIAECISLDTKEHVEYSIEDLVVSAEFGEPIYPYLQYIDKVNNAKNDSLWHTLIEADNYHALQLLEYLYAEKVDCIYIDPPYNTGAKDWKYNNDYVDNSDAYRHSKWLSMMEKRLVIAKKLLNPQKSVLIVTIDEKEYLHLGCLLEELFSEHTIQMISCRINPQGVARKNSFSRSDEYIYYVFIGDAAPIPQELDDEWLGVASTTKNELHWSSLLRTGTNNMRTDRANLFYPIFVSKDGKHFLGTGDSLPLDVDKETIVPPEGAIAIWPIHTDFTEGCWQVNQEYVANIHQKGYLRLGGFTPRGMAISYLKSGEQKKVDDGIFPVIGHKEDGSVIVECEDYQANYVPTTQWRIGSHDASRHGTNLLTSLIGEKRFTFPKSLYAVYDTLKFVISDNKNALIIDFFAGSGTTLHAVNLLNAEDNGKRRCIMVTNNEVSNAEAEALKAKGIKPGDNEWEKYGIARYVTWPRTVCSILGRNVFNKELKGCYGFKTDDYVLEEEASLVSKTTGNPIKKNIYIKKKRETYPELCNFKLSDGFKTNVVYYKLGFLDKTAVALGRQLKELIPVLWMKAGAIGECPTIDMHQEGFLIYPENSMAILLDEAEYISFEKELILNPSINTVYIVTNYDSSYRTIANNLNVKNTYQLYRDYLDNFRINQRRS